MSGFDVWREGNSCCVVLAFWYLSDNVHFCNTLVLLKDAEE